MRAIEARSDDGLMCRPSDRYELSLVLSEAFVSDRGVYLSGGGSSSLIGRPMERGMLSVSLRGLSDVLLYEPRELVISVESGCSLDSVEMLLSSSGQRFGFESPRLGGVLGVEDVSATVGGMASRGFAGPGRVVRGGVRDSVLGVRGVSGRGESFKSGGRVVKNVTGFDLSKLMTGSWGRLSALASLTFKTYPSSEDSLSVIVGCSDGEEAIRVLNRIDGGLGFSSGSAYFPSGMSDGFSEGFSEGFGGSAVIRLEGFSASLFRRRDFVLSDAESVLGCRPSWRVLDRSASESFWIWVRDVLCLSPRDSEDIEREAIWRIVCPPSRGGMLLSGLRSSFDGFRGFCDWGGGLIWCATPVSSCEDGGSDLAFRLRSLCESHDGRATLVRSPSRMRSVVSALHPPVGGAARLMERVRSAFDPRGILNRGRMTESLS